MLESKTILESTCSLEVKYEETKNQKQAQGDKSTDDKVNEKDKAKKKSEIKHSLKMLVFCLEVKHVLVLECGVRSACIREKILEFSEKN